jgi:hypothetical protein
MQMPEMDGAIALVKSYEAGFQRARDLASTSNLESSKRLVWFVAISGYGLLNGRGLWEALIGSSLSPAAMFWLVLPWVLAATVAVVGHVLFSKLDEVDSKLYLAKVAALQVLAIRLQTGDGSFEEFKTILEDEHAEIRPLRKDADRWHRLVLRTEWAAYSLVGVSVVWSVVAPWMIRRFFLGS